MTSAFGANLTGNVSVAGNAVSGASGVGGAVAAGAAVVGAGVGIVSAVASMIPATLACVTEPKAFAIVPFDFNPDKITFTRGVQPLSRSQTGLGAGSPAGGTGQMSKKSDPPDIAISDLIFEGLTTKFRCDQLLRWLSPVVPTTRTVQAGTGSAVVSLPPALMFVWGIPKAGFFYEVRLSKVTVAYTRFNPMGMPVRASIALTMQQTVSKVGDLPTNPTSGGPTGRRTHVVRSGDSLQSIATAHYGRPSVWRAIASANGIDDPTRVRPGTTVFLPIDTDVAGGIA